MGTLTERLEWVISANPDKAIAAFKATGASAERELGKATKAADKVSSSMMKWGAGAIGGSAAVIGALTKTVNATVKTEGAVSRLKNQTGLTADTASRYVKVLHDMSIDTDTVGAALGKMNVAVANNAGTFDKLGISIVRSSDGTLDVNKTFLNTVDVLSKMRSADERAAAGKAIFGKAWQQVSGIIAGGAEKMTAKLAEVHGADLFSNEQLAQGKEYKKTIAELGDAFHRLTISVGQGAMPVLGGVAKAITGVVDGFGKLNAISGGFVGKATAIVAVGTGIAGMASVVTGAAIKMATNLGAAGNAIGGLAVKLGVKTAAETVDATATEASVAAAEGKAVAVGAETVALEANTVALEANAAAQVAQGGASGAGEAFGLSKLGNLALFIGGIGAIAAEAQQASARTSTLTKQYRDLSTVDLSKLSHQIQEIDIQRAGMGKATSDTALITDIVKANPVGAARLLQGLRDGVVDLGNGEKDTSAFADKLAEALKNQTGAALDTAHAAEAATAGQLELNNNAAEGAGLLAGLTMHTNAYVEAQAAANNNAAEGAGLLNGLTAGVTRSADEARAAAAKWRGFGDALADLDKIHAGRADGIAEFGTALEAGAEVVAGSVKGNMALNESYVNLRESFHKNGKSVDEYTAKGRANIKAIMDTGDAIRNDLSQQLKDSGGDYAQVTQAAEKYRQQLADQLKPLKLNQDQLDEYYHLLGIAPDQINTAIKLSGQAEAKAKIDALNIGLDDFDDPVARKAYAEAVLTGDYVKVEELVRTMLAGSKTVTYTVNAKVNNAGDLRALIGGGGQGAGRPFTKDTNGDGVPDSYATGGPVRAGQPYLVGDGPGGSRTPWSEIFVPSTDGTIINAADTKRALNAPSRATGGSTRPQNVTHITLPGASTTSTVTAADTSTEDAVKEQDRLQAAMYETGRISLDAYRKYVQGRLAQSKDLSDDYVEQFRLLRELSDTERSSADTSIATQDDIKKAMYDTGQISLQSYKDYLSGRLGSYAEYSKGWVDIYNQIKGLNDDEVAAQKKRADDEDAAIQDAYQRAQATKALLDAQAEQDRQLNDTLAAGARGGRIMADRHSTADERAQAVQDLVDDETKLADNAYKTILASATQAGLKVGSVEWDRYMRGLIQSSVDNFNAQGLGVTAAALAGNLAGIPALAKGGIIKASPGGTLVRAGEAGKDEAVVPLDGRFGTTIVNHTINVHTLTGKLSPRDVDYIRNELAKGNRRNGVG